MMQRDADARAIAPGDVIFDRPSDDGTIALWFAIAIARANQGWSSLIINMSGRIRSSVLRHENTCDMPGRRIG